MSTVAALVFALLVLALLLFALASVGIVHRSVQLVPLGLAVLVLAQILRLWPP